MNIRKGPNSLGGKSENTISVAYRGIHPSFIGRIDINVCGNSDPGTSGVLTPFCETKGLYFVDRTEPEEFKFNFSKEISKLKERDGYLVFDLHKDIDAYYKSEEKIRELNKKFKVTEKSDMLIINIDVDENDI